MSRRHQAATSATLPKAACLAVLGNPNLLVLPSQRIGGPLPDQSVVWCEAAKCGSSTVWEMMRLRLNVSHGEMAGRILRVTSHKPTIPSRTTEVRRLRGPRAVLTEEEKVRLCEHRVVAFTTVRNPWDRLVSAFVNKVASANELPRRNSTLSSIRALLDLTEDVPISFGHFVRWLQVARQPAKNAAAGTSSQTDDNDLSSAARLAFDNHWAPLSMQCGADHLPYSLVLRFETLDDDLHLLVQMLQWDGDAAKFMPNTSFSSLRSCEMRRLSNTPECARINKELGARGLTLSSLSTKQKLHYFYGTQSSTATQAGQLQMSSRRPLELQLVQTVAQLYERDIKPFDYTFPR